MDLYNLQADSLKDHEVDELIEIVKDNEGEIERLEEIFKGRVKVLEKRLEDEVSKLKKENESILALLTDFARTRDDLRETKTRFAYDSLSGMIYIHKPKETILKPKDEEALKEVMPEFFEEVTEEKFAWAKAKKKLTLQNGKVFYGEQEISHLIPVKEVPPKTEVK